MFAEERQAVIVQIIEAGQPVTVAELSQRFEVSESTIRRDLQELENTGFIQRTHGGAIAVKSGFELSYQEKEIRFLDAKQKIAKAAAQLVDEGETVLLDSGTTTLQIALALRGKTITVATNSMEIAQVFVDDSKTEVILLGGALRKATRSLVGFLTNEALKQIYFDKVFLAANAVEAEFGATTPNLGEAETKRHMINAGKEIILVVDHTKIGQKGMCKICGLDKISLLLTDNGIEEAELNKFLDQVKVQVAT